MLNRLIRFSLVSAFALALAGHGVAMADSHEKGDGDTTEEPTAEPTEDGDANKEDGDAKNPCADGAKNPCADGADTAAAGSRKAVTKENYPTALNMRPLINPTGMIEAGVDLRHLRLSLAGVSANATGAVIGGSYVPVEKIEVGLQLGLGIDPKFELSKSIGLSAWYSVMEEGSGGKLDVAAGVTTALNFEDGADLLAGFTLHGLARYHLGPKMFVTAGSNLLEIGIEPSALSLNIDLGFYYQVNPNIAAGVRTRPAHIKLSGDMNATTSYSDVIPLGIDVLYGLDKMLDVRVSIDFPSIEDAGDLMTLSAGVAARF